MAEITAQDIWEKLTDPKGDQRLKKMAENGRVPGEVLKAHLLHYVHEKDPAKFRFGFLGGGKSNSEVLILIQSTYGVRVIKCGPEEEILAERRQFDSSQPQFALGFRMNESHRPVEHSPLYTCQDIDPKYSSISFSFVGGCTSAESLRSSLGNRLVSLDDLTDVFQELLPALVRWQKPQKHSSLPFGQFIWYEKQKIADELNKYHLRHPNGIDDLIQITERAPGLWYDKLSRAEGSTGICHCDLNSTNVIIGKSASKLSGFIIDFASATENKFSPALDWSKLERDIKLRGLFDANRDFSQFRDQVRLLNAALRDRQSHRGDDSHSGKCIGLVSYLRSRYFELFNAGISDIASIDYLYYLLCWNLQYLATPEFYQFGESGQTDVQDAIIESAHANFKTLTSEIEEFGVTGKSSRPRPIETKSASPKTPLPPFGVRRLLADYSGPFAGRAVELQNLTDFLKNDGVSCLLLLAPTGLGKTALLVRWIAEVRRTQDWVPIFVPISRRYGSSGAAMAWEAVRTGFLTVFGPHEVAEAARSGPKGQIADLLSRRMPTHKNIVVVFDGIDEAEGWEINRTLFPLPISNNLKFVVSSRSLPDMTVNMWLDQLGWSKSKTQLLNLQPLSRLETRELISQIGLSSTSSSISEELLAQISRISSGDPLTLKYLLEGVHDGIIDSQNLHYIPAGFEPLLRYWLRELEPELLGNIDVYSLFKLLSCALGPLQSRDIEALLPEVFTSRIALSAGIKRLKRFVVGDGSERAGYVLGHPKLREFSLDRLSESEKVEIEDRYLTYGQQSWNRFLSHNTPVPVYIRRFWIKHLARREAWERIQGITTDFRRIGGDVSQLWHRVRRESEDSDDGYLADLDMLWFTRNQEIDPVSSLRCAFISSSILTRPEFSPPELIYDLVTCSTTKGKMTFATAMSRIVELPSKSQRSAIDEFIRQDYRLPEDEVLRVLPELDNHARLRLLRFMLRTAPQAFVLKAYEKSFEIEYSGYRASAFSVLLEHATGDVKGAILQSTVQAAQSTPCVDCRILADIVAAQHSPVDQQEERWQRAVEIATSSQWGEISTGLWAISHVLPPQFVPPIVDRIQTLRNASQRLMLLLALRDRLDERFCSLIWRDTKQVLLDPGSNDAHRLSLKDYEQLFNFLHSLPSFRNELEHLSIAITDPYYGSLMCGLAVMHDDSKGADQFLTRLSNCDPEGRYKLWSFFKSRLPSDVLTSISEGFVGISTCPPEAPWLDPSRTFEESTETSEPQHLRSARSLDDKSRRLVIDELLSKAQINRGDEGFDSFVAAIAKHLSPVSLKLALARIKKMEPVRQLCAARGLFDCFPEVDSASLWAELLGVLPENVKLEAFLHLPQIDIREAFRFRLDRDGMDLICDATEQLPNGGPPDLWEFIKNKCIEEIKRENSLVWPALGRALGHLQRSIELSEYQDAWTEVLALRDATESASQGYKFAALTKYMPESLLPRALEQAKAARNEDYKIEILRAIAPRAHPEMVSPFIDIYEQLSSLTKYSLMDVISQNKYFYVPWEEVLFNLSKRANENEDAVPGVAAVLNGMATSIPKQFLQQAIQIGFALHESYKFVALSRFSRDLSDESIRTLAQHIEWRPNHVIAGKLSEELTRDFVDLLERIHGERSNFTPTLAAIVGEAVKADSRGSLFSICTQLMPLQACLFKTQEFDAIFGMVLDVLDCWP